MTRTPYPFESAVVDEVRRLGGTTLEGHGDLPIVERVQRIQFPKPLMSEGAVDVLLDEFAEAGVSGDDAAAAMRQDDDRWDAGLIWQAPGVAVADPASAETARLPLLDLAAHYPDLVPGLEDVCGAGVREVVHLGFSEGYPNYAFVRADDPNPGDPAVYSTDHEVYFREVDAEGSLSEYLGRMLTDETVYRMAREQLS